MFPRDRLVLLFTTVTTVLFQTHWIDDLGTDDRDVLGIMVAVVASGLLVSGFVLRKRLAGRALLVFAFLFAAFVSAADLCGLNADGTFAPSVAAHWRDGLGWWMTLATAVTLLSSLAGAAAILTTRAVTSVAIRSLPILIAVLCLVTTRVSSQETTAARAECFILARPGARPYISNAEECRHATSPASTFKIPHALIALDTGVVTRDTIFKWDGSVYANESWRRDHTLTTSIQWSALPFFQHTARQIGRERMQRGLAMLHYADDTFERDVDAFWINGDLVVSPSEQFAFLGRFVRGTVPISRAHRLTVLEAMRMPSGEVLMAAGAQPFRLTWPSDTIVRAKTGNTTVAGERVSWLIGALELQNRYHVFVARVRSAGALPSSAGADLALRELNAWAPR